ncbi:Rrf2 family transcriptional regulator [Pelagicoccus sp. SDUM812002]|uniref:Rrf2 family transcriptional regulator n=1 Tax=Pelagicoccus sp. SDUM812002 TaxID=3041266 RepID=UPI0031F2E5E2
MEIGDLVRTLDGPLAPIRCASQTAYERCSCPDEVHCGLRMLMIDVRNAVSNILDRYSLQNVVEVTLRKIRRSGADNYFMPMKRQVQREGDARQPRRPQRRLPRRTHERLGQEGPIRDPFGSKPFATPQPAQNSENASRVWKPCTERKLKGFSVLHSPNS